MQYYSIILFLVAIVVRCSAFINLDPQRCAHTKLSNDNKIHYDDFGTSFNDENSNSNSITSLTSRISEVKSVEQAYDGKIARNWSKGVSTLGIILYAPLCRVHDFMLILYTMTLTLYIP